MNALLLTNFLNSSNSFAEYVEDKREIDVSAVFAYEREKLVIESKLSLDIVMIRLK